jgi:hypothetical protein
MKKFFTIGIKKIFSIETIEERIEKGRIAMEEKKKKDFSSIGKPIKIGDLFVAQYDFPSMMNWQDAKKACEALGNYWRLPNVDELNFLFKNQDKIGGFAEVSYWSSTEHDSFACAQYFVNGFQHDYIKNDPYYVRAIRSF